MVIPVVSTLATTAHLEPAPMHWHVVLCERVTYNTILLLKQAARHQRFSVPIRAPECTSLEFTRRQDQNGVRISMDGVVVL
jgi:hypothetical protein